MYARFSEAVYTVYDSILDLLKRGAERYQGASRFGRMRLGLLLFLFVDVIVVLILATTVGQKLFEVEIWHQPGFPSSMIVLRNQDRPMKEVHLVLDGRYELVLETMPLGLKGITVQKEFRDAQWRAPQQGYQPSELVFRVGEREMRVNLRRPAQP